MAHSTNIISPIKLPNNVTYEIHDAQAIHNIEELGLSSALVFKGTKDTEAQVLAVTSSKVGDVWLAKDTNQEFVCIKAVGATADSTAWEKLGNIHDAASSTHTHTATVTGTNASSTVTGNVTVPTVSKALKAFCLPFGNCCHLMSQNKIAVSLPFPKDSPHCAIYGNNYLRATAVFL